MENRSENNTLTRYYTKKKRRKKRRKLMFYTLLTVFMVLVITVLSLTVFFNISRFEIEGNSHYSADEIIAASGLETGQNMFRLNKFDTIERIKSALPYVNDVNIRRRLPSGMTITVSESAPFAYINHQGGFYILDENLKVLEEAYEPAAGIPEIKGFAAESAQVGSQLTGGDGSEQTLIKLTQSMKENFGTENVTAINAGSIYELGFVYDGRVTVLLGSAERMNEKFKLTRYVIDENPSKEHAQIDVSSGKKAYYRSVTVDENNPETQN